METRLQSWVAPSERGVPMTRGGEQQFTWLNAWSSLLPAYFTISFLSNLSSHHQTTVGQPPAELRRASRRGPGQSTGTAVLLDLTLTFEPGGIQTSSIRVGTPNGINRISHHRRATAAQEGR